MAGRIQRGRLEGKVIFLSRAVWHVAALIDVREREADRPARTEHDLWMAQPLPRSMFANMKGLPTSGSTEHVSDQISRPDKWV